MARLQRQARADADILDEVQACGMEVDRQFGVVRLDTEGESVLVRGEVRQDAVPRLRAAGAELFPDFSMGSFSSDS
ncbi:MAG TPA: hypothetical protein VHG91_11000 [Longimicrobium sp.]|nr:hypothetical protein [Longimicrobium sp.]